MPFFQPVLPPTVFGAQSNPTSVISVDYRTRVERRLDRDFDESNPDNQSDMYHRIRIGFNWKAGKSISGLVQYQIAHSTMWKNGDDEKRQINDFYQLYAQAQHGASKITIGRQTINFGTERLIGSLDWSNTSRSYDAIRYQSPHTDAFVADIGVNYPDLPNMRLAAVSHKVGEGISSFVYKHDKVGANDSDIYTLSHAAKSTFQGLSLEAEGALQFGKAGGKDVEAWAYHLQASKGLSPTEKFSIEFNSASGGESATKKRTFDNLYPTNHKFYGLMDLHAWKNVNLFAAHFEKKLTSAQTLKLRYGVSSLRDASDAWYGAAGTPNKRFGGVFQDPTGQSGRDIGQEFDFEWSWKDTPSSTLSVGCGAFLPGKFVKRLSGDDQKQFFGFVQYARRF